MNTIATTPKLTSNNVIGSLSKNQSGNKSLTVVNTNIQIIQNEILTAKRRKRLSKLWKPGVKYITIGDGTRKNHNQGIIIELIYM
jgi:hypothetical protein